MNSCQHADRRLAKSLVSVVVTLLMSMGPPVLTIQAGDEPSVRLPIIVPVQLRESVVSARDDAPQEMTVVPQSTGPQPTLPEAKLPQYQLGHPERQRDATVDPGPRPRWSWRRGFRDRR